MTKEEILHANLIKEIEEDNEPQLHVRILKEGSIFVFYITSYIDNKTMLSPASNLPSLIGIPWIYNSSPISYKRKKRILKTIKEYLKEYEKQQI